MFQTTSSLAGLGLFLSGLRLLATSLQPLAGRRMRALLSKLTSGPWSSALAGSLLGALTQSTSASAFVSIGLVNSGSLSFQRALSIMAWSSVGTSLLVFLAAVDMRLAGLYVVGIVGIAHLFNAGRTGKAQNIVAFMFALGVLFLGLGMIKDSSTALREAHWLREYIDLISRFGVVSFLFGAIITLVAQSSATVTILVVTLNLSGLVNFQDAMFIVFGSSVGSGLSVAVATAHFTGRQRQLGIYQLIVKLIGALVLLPLCWVGSDSYQHILGAVGVKLPPATLLAVVYLALQIAGALAASIFQNRIMAVLHMVAPLKKEEALYSPTFIYHEAAADPDTAIILAAREQNRLVEGLQEYLAPLQADTRRSNTLIPTASLHAASTRLAGQIKDFIEEAAMNVQPEQSIDRLFTLQTRNELITSLQTSLFEFVSALENSSDLDSDNIVSMVESLHLVLSMLHEAVGGDGDDREMLLQLTADKSGIMDNMRASVVSEKAGSLQQRQALYLSTSLFERIIWLVRQLVQLQPVLPVQDASLTEQ
jgi:phosphate:Na+ symporter